MEGDWGVIERGFFDGGVVIGVCADSSGVVIGGGIFDVGALIREGGLLDVLRYLSRGRKQNTY